jgi:hypothetical protein
MIMWYQADLRDKHKRVWDQLNYAWLATFSCDLHAVGLEKWPETGPFAFNEAQSKWLTDTLRFLQQSSGRPRPHAHLQLCLLQLPVASASGSPILCRTNRATIIVIIVIIDNYSVLLSLFVLLTSVGYCCYHCYYSYYSYCCDYFV